MIYNFKYYYKNNNDIMQLRKIKEEIDEFQIEVICHKYGKEKNKYRRLAEALDTMQAIASYIENNFTGQEVIEATNAHNNKLYGRMKEDERIVNSR